MTENRRTDNLTTAGRIAEQAGLVLLSQWDEFRRLRKIVLSEQDVDAIHDLRVASRRLRATADLLGPFIAAAALKGLSKKIRRVTRELGHVRNIDEAIMYCASLPAPLPTLTAGLGRARQKEMAAVVKVLRRFPFKEMGKLLKEAAAELAASAHNDRSDQSLPVYVSDRSVQRFQVLHDLLAPAIVPENVELRHRLRIAIKKWRYLLETVGQVCGQDYSATLEILKEYQTLLGRLNDMVAFAVLAGRLKLPPDETDEFTAALERDTTRYLTEFIQLVASRPLQYTFLL